MILRHRSGLLHGVVFLLVAALLFAIRGGIEPGVHAQVPAGPAKTTFPPELVHWSPIAANPVFTAEGPGHWDAKIRERGWILRENGVYHLWFTGYDGTDEGMKRLGYATSPDGIHWKRSPKNPLCPDHYVEDVMIVKCGDTHFMFAEGDHANHAVMLTSKDRVNWKWEGPLDVRLADGKTRVPDPCGTPTIWIENGVWHLFYERLDKGIWLATTVDVRSRRWVNVQNEPVLVPGPGKYDEDMIALNQIIKYRGAYYAFYHGSGITPDTTPRTWNTNIVRSTDLRRWKKYAGNPLIENNKSSGIVIRNGRGYRMYTMHDQIDVFTPSRN